MQKKHKEPGKRISIAHILLGRANNGTTFEGGRGTIKKRMVRQPVSKVSMMGTADNGAAALDNRAGKDTTTNH